MRIPTPRIISGAKLMDLDVAQQYLPGRDHVEQGRARGYPAWSPAKRVLVLWYVHQLYLAAAPLAV
jgi:hypothetical protein